MTVQTQCKVLTILTSFSPTGSPAQSSIEELAGAAGKADGSDVVGKSDWGEEPHQGKVIVVQCVVVVRMDDDLGHTA